VGQLLHSQKCQPVGSGRWNTLIRSEARRTGTMTGRPHCRSFGTSTALPACHGDRLLHLAERCIGTAGGPQPISWYWPLGSIAVLVVAVLETTSGHARSVAYPRSKEPWSRLALQRVRGSRPFQVLKRNVSVCSTLTLEPSGDY